MGSSTQKAGILQKSRESTKWVLPNPENRQNGYYQIQPRKGWKTATTNKASRGNYIIRRKVDTKAST